LKHDSRNIKPTFFYNYLKTKIHILYLLIYTIIYLFWVVFRFTIREQSKDNGIMSELGISPVYRHDTGFFKCTGSNYYGQDENSIELIVQGM